MSTRTRSFNLCDREVRFLFDGFAVWILQDLIHSRHGSDLNDILVCFASFFMRMIRPWAFWHQNNNLNRPEQSRIAWWFQPQRITKRWIDQFQQDLLFLSSQLTILHRSLRRVVQDKYENKQRNEVLIKHHQHCHGFPPACSLPSYDKGLTIVRRTISASISSKTSSSSS